MNASSSALQKWIDTLYMYSYRGPITRPLYREGCYSWAEYIPRPKREDYRLGVEDSIAIIATRVPHTSTAASRIVTKNGVTVRIVQNGPGNDVESYLGTLWTMFKEYHAPDLQVKDSSRDAARRIRRYIFEERYNLWAYKLQKCKSQARIFLGILEQTRRESPWGFVPTYRIKQMMHAITEIIRIIDSKDKSADGRQLRDSIFEELEKSYEGYKEYFFSGETQNTWQSWYNSGNHRNSIEEKPFSFKRFVQNIYSAHLAAHSLCHQKLKRSFRGNLKVEVSRVDEESVLPVVSTRNDISSVISQLLQPGEKEDMFQPGITYEDHIKRLLADPESGVHHRPKGIVNHLEAILLVDHIINESPQNPLPKSIGSSKYTGTCILCALFFSSVKSGIARNVRFRRGKKVCLDWRLPETLGEGARDAEDGVIEAIRKKLSKLFKDIRDSWVVPEEEEALTVSEDGLET